MRTKARDRRLNGRPDATAAAEQGRVSEPTPGRQRNSEQPAYRPLRRRRSRLGSLEYTLLALVAVGIAVTLAMAILNPSG